MPASYSKLFAVILTVLTLLRVAISAVFPLAADEAYHWEWSRHLAFGYYDHPPMTAYVIHIFTTLLGDNEIGVRFGAVVCMTLASVVMFKFGRDISGDDRVAFWAGLLVNIIPVFNVFFVYMSTDPATIFFWALTLWIIYRAIFQGRKHYWYLLGLALGGALLTKFLNLIFIPSIALFIVCSKEHRGLLLRKEPYLAGLVAFLIVSPFIYWNATHDWATFVFNLSARHNVQVDPRHLVEYIGGQVLVVSPFLFLGYIWLNWRCWVRGLSKQHGLHLFLATTSSVMFGFFLLISLIRSVGAHWPAAGYLTSCVGLPYYALVEKDALMLRHARKSVITALVILGVVYAFLFAVYFFPAPMVDFASRFVEESKELYEIHDYKGIGAETERRANQHDAIVISPSYGVCSTLSFYTPSQLQLHMFGEGRVYGRNYKFWDNDYASYLGRNALWVHVNPPAESALQAMRRSFESVGALEKYPITSRGRTLRTFYFVPCRNLIEYRPK